MITRRNFVVRMAQGVGASMAWPLLQGCSGSSYTQSLSGPDFTLGHRLRSMDFGPVTVEEKTGTVIIGGGVAGLSAARYLKKNNIDFLLFELDHQPGGNAMGGSNNVSAYPWGAHYLPLPGSKDPELISFLQESDVITGFQNGLPVYNEYYLCFDPKERLYINQYWQEGLIPHEGVPGKDREEINRFLALMHDFKTRKGSDGLDAFAIPIDFSSQDALLLALDKISMQTFLTQNGFTSPYLLWYVNYCCADDFGSSVEETSAWAAIHYFASRNGQAFNASSDTVLTWPEGNFWLVQQLKKNNTASIRTRALAYSVQSFHDHVEVLYYDANTHTSGKVTAQHVILATPQFVTQRLLRNTARDIDYKEFQYAPWMVANVTTNASLLERRGEPVSWDNVLYGSTSLGYVNANNQHTGIAQKERVLTYYKPLLGTDTTAIRKQAYETTAEQWADVVLADFKKPHPEIEKHINSMDIWIWGHGMIRPAPGFMWGENRKKACASLNDRVHFAHSDLSGISIFEEAFYRGHRAAQTIVASV